LGYFEYGFYNRKEIFLLISKVKNYYI